MGIFISSYTENSIFSYFFSYYFILYNINFIDLFARDLGHFALPSEASRELVLRRPMSLCVALNMPLLKTRAHGYGDTIMNR